jgi:hypothetical protein
MKRELKRRLIYEYRCDERLKTKKEESTHLVDTGLVMNHESMEKKSKNIESMWFQISKNVLSHNRSRNWNTFKKYWGLGFILYWEGEEEPP